jgi:hypothetical protein
MQYRLKSSSHSQACIHMAKLEFTWLESHWNVSSDVKVYHCCLITGRDASFKVQNWNFFVLQNWTIYVRCVNVSLLSPLFHYFCIIFCSVYLYSAALYMLICVLCKSVMCNWSYWYYIFTHMLRFTSVVLQLVEMLHLKAQNWNFFVLQNWTIYVRCVNVSFPLDFPLA